LKGRTVTHARRKAIFEGANRGKELAWQYRLGTNLRTMPDITSVLKLERGKREFFAQFNSFYIYMPCNSHAENPLKQFNQREITQFQSRIQRKLGKTVFSLRKSLYNDVYRFEAG
jgi:hypothetical protein